MANENLKAQEIYGIRIKDLPQVTEVNDTDDIIIEDSTPITRRVKIGTLFGSVKNPYKNKTIVAFGDSIIAGWGWKEGTGIIQPLKEKYPNATWINKAESGANMAVTSNPSHTPIVNQVTSYTGAADAIILDGGVNDKNNGISIGSIATAYDATYDISTFCGALESALQHIMDTYPLAVKLYIIPHSFAKDNSYVDSIYSKAIEICDKWNMPYLDMRKCSQIAMTSKNKSKYTYNPNSKKGDGVHPNETWYRTFYCPVIDQALQYQGIGSITASEAPEIVAVTGVKLDQTTLTLDAGDSAQLTATVSPSNATNKSVTWSASNSNVSVSGGKVTAKTAGMTDEQILEYPDFVEKWESGKAYAVGKRLEYNGTIYKVLQAHTSQETWIPPDAPSLFAKVLIPDENVIPEWEQPNSTNPYAKGDKVTHNGKTWQSTMDNNVWEPGVYGWEEV